VGDVRLLHEMPDEAVVSALALDAALELSNGSGAHLGGAGPADPVVALGGALRRLSDPSLFGVGGTAPAPGAADRLTSPPARQRRRREALVAAAAVTVAGGGALVLGTALSGTPTGPPAAALRTGLHGGVVRLTSAGSGEGPGGVVTGVACTGARTCLAVAAGAGAESLIVRSTDGGSTWSEVAGPEVAGPGMTATAVTCPTARRCVAVGSSAGHGAVLLSADGGRTWTAGVVPAGVTSLSGIACPSSAACVAVGDGDAVPALISSSDGGRRWQWQSAPVGLSTATAVACPTTLVCEVGGSAGRRPAFASTTDGGARWALTSVRAPDRPPAPGTVDAVTCTSPGRCWAVGTGGGAVAVFASDATGTWRVASDGPVPPAGMTGGGGPSCGAPCGGVPVGPALRLLEGHGGAAGSGGRLRLDAVTCPAAPQCWTVQPAAGGFTATATLTATTVASPTATAAG